MTSSDFQCGYVDALMTGEPWRAKYRNDYSEYMAGFMQALVETRGRSVRY